MAKRQAPFQEGQIGIKTGQESKQSVALGGIAENHSAMAHALADTRLSSHSVQLGGGQEKTV